jgi:septal ring factor EnvC (AmiA/AmiB activator)
MNIHPNRIRTLAALAIAAGTLHPAHAVDTGERARIASERAEVEKRYADRERACGERFVVTSCVDDAKRERRESLDALRARELKLDEEIRRARTDARRAELAAKAADDARRDQERVRAASAPARAGKPFESPRGASASSSGHESHDRPLGAGDRLGIEPTQRGSETERSEREAASRASYEARQRQAAEHRREVDERNAKRLSEHPAATSLPTPGASAPR